MKKILITIGIGLVLLLVIVVVAVGLFLDSAIKRGVETIGPTLTKVDIKLDKVSLSLFSGAGSLRGLVVGNPEGFKTPQAISLGGASFALKPGSLLSDKIVINSIKVEAPEITFEAGLGGNNLSRILANVEAATGGGKTNAAAETKAPPAAEQKSGKKLQVDEFVITGAKVHLSVTGMSGKPVTIALPPIQLTGLGTGPDGITGAELTGLVLKAVYEATRKAAGDSGYDLGKMADKLAKDLSKNLDQGTAEDLNKLGRSIGDLLKKK